MSPGEVAERLLPLFPALDEAGRRLSLAIYRALAQGAPVRLAALFQSLGMDAGEGERRVRSWPGVYFDSEQRIIGFWGLALGRMQHRLRIGGRELFAWCAWDTLFLPGVLGARAEVLSACATGEAVRLTVGPRAVESAEPQALSVSFVVPEGEAIRTDVVSSFCHHVHFFSPGPAAKAWSEEHREAALLPLAEAFEVGRLFNRNRYGAAR